MAKSIIMMAFFFTIPMSRITPISAMMLNSVCHTMSASTAPTPAEGRVEMMVIGMHVALVKHAEHDVDREQCRRDEQRLARERLLERICGAREYAVDEVGMWISCMAWFIARVASLKDMPACRLNDSVVEANSPCDLPRGGWCRRSVCSPRPGEPWFPDAR